MAKKNKPSVSIVSVSFVIPPIRTQGIADSHGTSVPQDAPAITRDEFIDILKKVCHPA